MTEILIVDDKAENLYMMRALLEGHGYTVSEARHGAEALTKARQVQPQLVISDLLMPVMDGYTLLRHWKTEDRLKGIPFVVYTATYTEPRDERLALDLGADAFILKPAEPEALMARITEILTREKHRQLPPNRMQPLDEGTLLKQYNETIVRKLEEKILQSEAAHAELLEVLATRERAETELRRSEQELADFFENATVGLHWVGPDGIILRANRAELDMLGYRREEYVGRPISDFHVEGEVISAILKRLRAGEKLDESPARLRCKDGSTRDVLIDFSVMWEDGKFVYTRCISRDVTEQKRSDDRLKKSEERYRTLIAATSAIVWDSPASGEFDSDQPGWTAFTGQTVEQHRGWGWLNAVHPDDRDKSAHAWSAALANRTEYRVEHRLRRADGQFRLMSVRAVPIFEPNGEIREWVGVHTDVTDQQRIEIERAELLSQLTLQIERMPLAYLLSGPDGRYTRWNSAAERMFGFSEAEILGRLPSETIVPPQTKAIVADIFARLAAGDMNAHGTCENVTKDGRTIDCEWHNTPLFSLNGVFQGVLSLAQDVTFRLQAEKKLQLRDRAIQAATQGLVITDAEQPDSPIIYVSPGFERITGYSSEEALGRNCRFLQGADTDPAAVDRLREAIQTEQSCTVELLNYRKDGKSFWNELSISPVRSATGQLTHFVGVQADVTARRNLQEQFRQAQKMEAIGQLAGGVAHDFNNLLTIIGGNSEYVLADPELNGELREAVQEIREASERAAALTQKLLAFSRQALLELKVVDMNAIIADTGRILRRLIDESIQINTVLAPHLLPVRVDPTQFDQILMNLAVNARDAMPNGGQLTIETSNVVLGEEYSALHPDCTTGPHVMLAMTDTGCGMTPEVVQRIFEPFFTTKAPGKGTGLGLAMVFGIVQQSGGCIHVYSEPGRGTTFKIYFPVVHESSSPKETTIADDKLGGQETILLVEDEEGVRRLTLRYLTQYGYQVLVAANAAEAIHIALSHVGTIDLLLTDVVMPNGSGPQLAERIRQHLPQLRVLYMSGYTDDTVVRHGLLHADVSFLQKPFGSLDLMRKIRNILDDTPPQPAIGH